MQGSIIDICNHFNTLADLAWPLVDLICSVFSFTFYIFVTGLGLYGIASVVYNLVLLHKRHKEERPEPPTARVAGTVYPNEKGGDTE